MASNWPAGTEIDRFAFGMLPRELSKKQFDRGSTMFPQVLCHYSLGSNIDCGFEGWDGTLRLLDTDSGMELQTIRREELTSVNRGVAAMSWNRQRAATAGRDGILRVFDVNSAGETVSLGSHQQAITAVSFAPDDQLLASSDSHGKVVVWDLGKRTARTVLEGHSGSVRSFSFSDEGQRLCTGGLDRKVNIWDVASKPTTSDICQEPRGFPTCVAFSPDGRLMASGVADYGAGLVTLWDVATGRLEHQFEGSTNWIWSVAFAPDGRALASTGIDGAVRVWDLASHTERMAVRSDNDYMSWVNFSKDGTRMFGSGWHNEGDSDFNRYLTLRVWDRNGLRVALARINKSSGWQPTVSPDGCFLVVGDEGAILLLDSVSLETKWQLPCSTVGYYTAAFSPDGQTLACVFGSHVELLSLDGQNPGHVRTPSRCLVIGLLARWAHLSDWRHGQSSASLGPRPS